MSSGRKGGQVWGQGYRGRGRGQGRDSPTPEHEKYYFSTIKLQDLQVLFNCTYLEHFVDTSERSSGATHSTLRSNLVASVASATGREWKKVCDTFAKFFATATPIYIAKLSHRLYNNCSPFLKCNNHKNLFSNGAGKLFLFQLLSLTQETPLLTGVESNLWSIW